MSSQGLLQVIHLAWPCLAWHVQCILGLCDVSILCTVSVVIGTLTMNEMTVTKAWVAGTSINNILDYGPNASKNDGERLSSRLDHRVVSLLNRSIALNCTASLRRQDTGHPHNPLQAISRQEFPLDFCLACCFADILSKACLHNAGNPTN